MEELFLKRIDTADYISKHHLQEISPKKEVLKYGRKYTQISLEYNLSPLVRMAKALAAVAIIVVTLGIALLFQETRDLISESFSGKAPVHIYALSPRLEAKMRVLSRSTGYIGEEDDQTEWPEYWQDMTLENGNPIPLNAKDCVVKVQLYDFENELPPGLEDVLYLPYKLLKKVMTGEILRLNYRGELIELEAKQLTNLGVEPFEDYVRGVKSAFIRDEHTDLDTTSYFSTKELDDLFFYTLQGGGTVFELNLNSQRPERIRQREYQVLPRLIQNGHLSIKNCHIHADRAGGLLIMAEMRRTESVDVLLNSKFVVFAYNGTSGVRINKARWDIIPYLTGKTLEEMNRALLNAQVIYNEGRVILTARV